MKGNIFDYETLTGQKGNLLNPMDWLKLIIGVIVVIVALSMGQQIATKADEVIPGNQTKINALFTQPTTVKTVENNVGVLY